MIGPVQLECASTGRHGTSGCLKGHLVAAATTNATLVKAAGSMPVVVANFVASNNSAAVKWMKFFDKATTPVPGTDTPFWSFPIPANGGVVALSDTNGLFECTLGFGFAITGASPDADATAVALGDVTFNYNVRF